MPEPTPNTGDAKNTGQDPSSTGTPIASGKGSGEATSSGTDGPALVALQEQWKQREAAKDREINRLRQEGQAAVRRLAQMQQAAAPAAVDPLAAQMTAALDNLDPKSLQGVVQAEAQRIAQAEIARQVPGIVAAERRAQNVDAGFQRLREAGVDTPPEELRLDRVLADGIAPDEAYLLKLRREKGPEASLAYEQNLVDERKKKAAQAKILSSIAEGGPGSTAQLALSPASAPVRPGQVGYVEGEEANFMFELGKAPHARKVKEDEWVSEEDHPLGQR